MYRSLNIKILTPQVDMCILFIWYYFSNTIKLRNMPVFLSVLPSLSVPDYTNILKTIQSVQCEYILNINVKVLYIDIALPMWQKKINNLPKACLY